VRPNASFWAPATVVCFAAFFCAAYLTAGTRSPVTALLVVLVPAAVSAVLATLQSTQIWYPWTIDDRVSLRLRTSGLIGNPNDLGTYLVLPALAAFGAGLAWRRHRWLLIVAMVLVAGLASAQSVTPFIAAVAGVFIMAITSKTRRLRLVVIGAVLALLAAAIIHPGSRTRFQSLLASTSSGELPEMTSFRIVPAMAAFQMFLDRPLVGVGPGSFSSMYMTYKLRIDEKYPQWLRLGNESFEQVHNDHMQTGLPGYLLFLGALVLLALISLRRNGVMDPEDPRTQFARIFALPAAVSFGVLALAQFPLQLTAPMVPALYLAALCFAWTNESR
jgi:O-antigen ligase